MNVLYLHKKSKWGKELKYSLRSLEMYVDYDDVWIVGDKPEWLTNVNYMEWEQQDENRYQDSLNRVKQIRGLPGDEWLIMHDDMYYLEPYEPVVHHNGLFKDRMKGTAGNRKQAMENTFSYFKYTAKNYELHYPIPTGWGYVDLMCKMEIPEPYLFMSILGNLNQHYPEKEAEDCKFHNESITTKKLEGLPCFSTGGENDRLLHLFEQLYPNKSTFER